MEASSQLVNLSTKGVSKLVEAVAESLESDQVVSFLRESNELVAQAKAPELIRKLLEYRSNILGMPRDEDVEGCAGILFSLLYKTSDRSQVPVLAKEIADALLDEQDGKAALRLKLVTNLYNMLPDRSPGQLEILMSIIKYAAKARLLGMMGAFFSGVDEWVQGWDLKVEDQRRLFSLIADVLQETGNSTEAQRFLMRYLALFNGASKEELAGAKQAAQRGAIGAVKAPIVSFTEQHNLLGMDVVAQLQDDPAYSKVYQLLHIFSVEKLEAYMAFQKANAATLKQHSIDHEQCVGHMRLLSLCSLATEHEEIPYSAIAETLQVPKEEVEVWVLRAIQANLMEAKMDQLQQVVIISRCINRVFGDEQWRVLQIKLRTWHKNVQALLSTIRKSNESYEQ